MKLIIKQFSKEKEKEKKRKALTKLAASGVGVGLIVGGKALKSHGKSKINEILALKNAECYKNLGGDAPWIDTTKKENLDRIKLLSKNKKKDLTSMIDKQVSGNRDNFLWVNNIIDKTGYKSQEDAEKAGQLLSGVLHAGAAKENQLKSALERKNARQLGRVALAVGLPGAGYLAYRSYKNNKNKKIKE